MPLSLSLFPALSAAEVHLLTFMFRYSLGRGLLDPGVLHHSESLLRTRVHCRLVAFAAGLGSSAA